MIETPAQRMLAMHTRGDSYRTIAEVFGLSHEGVRQMCAKQAVELLTSIEMSMYLAQKLERMARENEAIWPAFLIPHQVQPDWQLALSLFEFVVGASARAA